MTKSGPKTDVEVLCRLMERHGVSQNGLARDIGVDPATINRVVQQRATAERSGRNILSRRVISGCAARFDVEVAAFFPELAK